MRRVATCLCALALMLGTNRCLAASIDDQALVYSIFQNGDVLIRPSTEAWMQYPDLLSSAGGVEVRYRYNDATQQGAIAAYPPTADLSFDVYLVQPGDVFARNAITSGKFPILKELDQWGHQLLVGEELYLGLATGITSPVRRTHFGWAHLKRVNGLLTLIDQTLALQSDGIIVGTRIPVPEPSATILLLSSALIAFSVLRHRPAA